MASSGTLHSSGFPMSPKTHTRITLRQCNPIKKNKEGKKERTYTCAAKTAVIIRARPTRFAPPPAQPSSKSE